jgi:FixJ family two-component response regulator
MEEPTQSELIAIVDNESTVLTSLARLFGSMGLRVVTFQSGGDFLRAAEQTSFDCMLVDLGLPGVTGLDVIREVGARLPCIAISGRLDDDIDGAARRAGACAYLTKPIDASAFMASVQ